MQASEFLVHARLDAHVLETWIEAGWLLPQQDGRVRDFSDVDLARAQLIVDLRQLGVNDEGIPVILDLVDQLHGLRRMLRELLAAIQAHSDASPQQAADAADDAVRPTQPPGSDRKQTQ
jgi:chaperone modulatory protein CbpM